MLLSESQNGNQEVFDLRVGLLIDFSLDFKIDFSGIDFILVVEKDSFFESLKTANFFERFPNSLLVTGKGYPDYNTKYFLKIMTHHLPNIPIFYLGDSDPHGLEIYLNYLIGTQISCYENFNIGNMVHLGVDGS